MKICEWLNPASRTSSTNRLAACSDP